MYLALPDGTGNFNGRSSGSHLLRILPTQYQKLYRTFTSFGYPFQNILTPSKTLWQSFYPIFAVTKMVWALSCSLATTYEIILIFSSYGYLDVSVPHVGFLSDSISSIYWVLPFGHLYITALVQLRTAFRSLTRPSSPSRAKAFPVRPSFTYLYLRSITTCQRTFLISNRCFMLQLNLDNNTFVIMFLIIMFNIMNL